MPMPVEAAADWGYVSGRCASLETGLLDEGFFRDLLAVPGAAEAHALLAKTPYTDLFPHSETLGAFDRLLRDDFRGRLRSLRADSPPHGPAEIALREMELEEVHALLARQGIAQASADEAGRWAARLGGGFSWLAGFAVPADRRALFAAQPVRALSLWADAAYLEEMIALAGRQPALAPYVGALVSLTTLEVCWRSFRSGIGAEWLEGFFFRPPLPAPPAKALAAAERSPTDAARLLGPPDFDPPQDGFEESFGRAADDHLTGIARRGAYEVAGPRRVLWYVRRLWVESFNLRLCLAAVIAPLDRREARERLRSG